MAQGSQRSRSRLPFWLLVLACLEVVGGAFGAAVCARNAWLWLVDNAQWSSSGLYVPLWSYQDHASRLTGLFLLTMVLGGLLYAAAVVAGVLILRRKRRGVALSVVLQCLQVPWFRVAGMGYYFLVGASVGVGFQLSDSQVWTSTSVGSDYLLLLSGAEPPMVGLNLVPMIFLFFLTPMDDVFPRDHAEPGPVPPAA